MITINSNQSNKDKLVIKVKYLNKVEQNSEEERALFFIQFIHFKYRPIYLVLTIFEIQIT